MGTHADRSPKSGRLGLVLPIIGIVAGLVLLGAPIITDWLEAYNASQTISRVSDSIDTMDDPEIREVMAQARGYNARLSKGDFDATSGGLSDAEPAPVASGEVWDYGMQLLDGKDPMMAWVEIPKIAVKEPIYHGTNDATLSAGVGHVEGTSLPVGGISSNCVLSAHSGVPSARMFDDLHKLEPGDTFTLWALGKPCSYRVTGSKVVLPDKTDDLLVEAGHDRATLVTCTPYGVNSHRLLVFGERCEYVPGEVTPASAYLNDRTLPFVAGLVAVVAAMAIIIALGRRKRKKKSKEA